MKVYIEKKKVSLRTDACKYWPRRQHPNFGSEKLNNQRETEEVKTLRVDNFVESKYLIHSLIIHSFLSILFAFAGFALVSVVVALLNFIATESYWNSEPKLFIDTLNK